MIDQIEAADFQRLLFFKDFSYLVFKSITNRMIKTIPKKMQHVLPLHVDPSGVCDHGDGVFSCLMTITEEIADDWTDKYINPMLQRFESKNNTEFLIREQSTGKWLVTGDPIKFTYNQDNKDFPISLIDKNHTLSARKQSGVDIQIMVQFNLPEAVYFVVDTNRVRSASDLLGPLFKYPKYLAGACRIVMTYDAKKYNLVGHVRKRIFSNTQIIDFAFENPQLSDFVSECVSIKYKTVDNVVSISQTAAIFWLFNRQGYSYESVLEAIKAIQLGVGDNKDHVIFKLRDRIFKLRAEGSSPDRNLLMGLLVEGVYKYVSGDFTADILYRKDVKFPVIKKATAKHKRLLKVA